MAEVESVHIGLSKTFPCSYLKEQSERLLMIIDPIQSAQFEQLLAFGFRRSGTQIYRPNCPSCHACIPVRLPVTRFKPSQSQKRVINKNADLRWQVTNKATQQHKDLYFKYINERHHDGAMYPPSTEQFDGFILCNWLEQWFLEAYLDDELVLVAVTDLLPNSLSAIYTFFDPALAHRSLGKRAILKQIELAQKNAKQYVYLGYQIHACSKMAYKTQFQPIECLQQDRWQDWQG